MNYQEWMREVPADAPMMTQAEWQAYQAELQEPGCPQCGGPLTTPTTSPLALSPYCEPCARAWSEPEQAESDALYGAGMSGALPLDVDAT